MREPPKMTIPYTGEQSGVVYPRLAREINAVVEWMTEAIADIRGSQQHLDDCPAAGYGECNCGLERRPC